MLTLIDTRSKDSADLLPVHIIKRQWRVGVRVGYPPKTWTERALYQEKIELSTLLKTAKDLSPSPHKNIILTDYPIRLAVLPETDLIAWCDRNLDAAIVTTATKTPLYLAALLQMVGLLHSLPHCDDPLCAMWFAESLNDIARPVVCSGCRSLIMEA